MLKHLFLLIVVFTYSSVKCYADSKKDSLLNFIDTTTSFIDKVDRLIDISVIHSDQLESDSAISYANQALKLSKDQNMLREVGQSYYAIAYAYDMTGKLKDAFENYELARQSFEKIGIPLEVAKAMNAKGAAAYFGGDFDLAIKYYLAALTYDEEHNLLEEQGDVLNNIALIYENNGKLKEARNMFERALKINKEVKDTAGVAHEYHTLGSIYLKLGDFNKAISYLDSSIYINRLLRDTVLMARSFSEKGSAYLSLKKDYKLAKANALKAKVLFDRHPDQTMQFDNYIILGKNENSISNFPKAINYFEQALNLIIDTEREDKKLEVYQYLKELYGSTGDYKKAFKFSQSYELLFKDIQHIEKVKYIEDVQTKYETDQKEKQIQIQELKLSQVANEKKLFIILLMLFAIALSSAIAFVFLKMKSNKKLSKQKLIIEDALKEKDILLREIHHRVKNNLQVISSLLSLQGRYTDDPGIESAIRDGKDRVKSMSLIHQNLYQKDNLTGVDVKDYFTKLFKSLFSSYNIKPDKIKLKLEISSINLDVDSIVPIGLVVNELVSNALKHAFPQDREGTISVSLQEDGDSIILIVEDDGIGMDTHNLHENESIGYTLIESFKNKLNADVQINGEGGTKITLQIKQYNKVA